MIRARQSDTSIAFYLPYDRDGISSIPSNVNDYWAWVCSNSGMAEGKYSWTLQTYLQLSQIGKSYSLVTKLPKKGIIITHRDFLPIHLLPHPDLFIVCIKPDRKEHPWAQHYVVQSHNDPIIKTIDRYRVSEALHWPQPSLIPRNNNRGSRVENIAYFGRLDNLEHELQSIAWKEELHSLGFNWLTVPMNSWNDYSDIDVTVSIRGWVMDESKLDAVTDWNSKPPTKLTNSWLANVPAIVGDEPAFNAVGGNGTDCIVVKNLHDLKSELLTLRNNPDYYMNLQKHGFARAKEFSVEHVKNKWQELIEGDIMHMYCEWMNLSRVRRQMINVERMIEYFLKPKNLIDPVHGIIRTMKKT